MKQSLQLKVGQNLTMTPQLQQAIKLLQLSSIELHTEIQEMLYSNPMLEMNEGDSGEVEDSSEDPSAEQNQQADQALQSDDFSDRNWEASASRSSGSTAGSGPVDDQFNRPEEISLQEHLRWQLNMTQLSPTDIRIGEAIIDAIDPSGFLSISTEEILSGLPDELDHSELIAVLHRIQRFDPPGIGARDLKECLHVQADMLDPDTPALKEAMHIIDNYLSLVGNMDIQSLARRCRMRADVTESAVELIRSLNPRPGYSISSESPDYVIPDVVVSKVNDEWRVSLNPDNAPALSISESYAELARNKNFASDKAYMKDKLQEARWFIRSLESRNQTLMRVAKAIVEHQRGFFEIGPVAMKPLVLRELAEELSLHESTISRATNQKFMSCPRGMFELKYFFSSQVATSEGGEFSSTAIKALLEELIGTENPRKPLSDNKLTNLLNEQGIMVARRTVAKYRELLGIAASSERKRLS